MSTPIRNKDMRETIKVCIELLKIQYISLHDKQFTSGSIKEGANAIRALEKQLSYKPK